MYIQVNKETKKIDSAIYFSLHKPLDNENYDVFEVDFIPQDWKYCIFEDGKFKLDEDLKQSSMIDEVKETIRKNRREKCFPIINRGQFWYDSLTESQLNELRIWYQAWLDATITLVEPNDLDWVK